MLTARLDFVTRVCTVQIPAVSVCVTQPPSPSWRGCCGCAGIDLFHIVVML